MSSRNTMNRSHFTVLPMPSNFIFFCLLCCHSNIDIIQIKHKKIVFFIVNHDGVHKWQAASNLYVVKHFPSFAAFCTENVEEIFEMTRLFMGNLFQKFSRDYVTAIFDLILWVLRRMAKWCDGCSSIRFVGRFDKLYFATVGQSSKCSVYQVLIYVRHFVKSTVGFGSDQ